MLFVQNKKKEKKKKNKLLKTRISDKTPRNVAVCKLIKARRIDKVLSEKIWIENQFMTNIYIENILKLQATDKGK